MSREAVGLGKAWYLAFLIPAIGPVNRISLYHWEHKDKSKASDWLTTMAKNDNLQARRLQYPAQRHHQKFKLRYLACIELIFFLNWKSWSCESRIFVKIKRCKWGWTRRNASRVKSRIKEAMNSRRCYMNAYIPKIRKRLVFTLAEGS